MAISAINDNVYGRYFLQDIEPAWQRDSILRDLYRYAKPWATDLSGIDSQQLITELLQQVIDMQVQRYIARQQG
ncbi:hypothetical protein [Arsukibacterium indicum]|uniref:Uncharacterized protein n=1 Tax=Arsukibacterium indicum TaxID=2848612 RepID=A0ABS6MNY3_9GAMM|nr:hypothetical protein [Arsukibacterium indicum]MBV2130506.1 hypothetical protein [Arsukibacterium indicum]